MVHIHLAKTALQVHIDNVEAPAFETIISTPQGDSLSLILFYCYYEAVMYVGPSLEISSLATGGCCRGYPSEMQHADD